jgi:hypothetical protein
MNIYQKLIEVRKSVPYLKKDNSGFQFKYVSSSQTLGSLREAMDAQGLLLIPRVISTEVRDHTTRKGDHEYFSIFTMTFTWVNADVPEETIECSWTGHGLDDAEKGAGKAMTYAEKYFLLKFFNIATDKDDPDSFQKPDGSRKETAKTPEPDFPPEQDTPPNGHKGISAAKAKGLHSFLGTKGIKDAYDFATTTLGRPIAHFSDMTDDESEKVKQAALGVK